MPQLVVAIDANVLIASLLVSTGACRRLMEFASLGIFRPVITSEVLAEAERHCRKGIRGRVITNAEIQVSLTMRFGPTLITKTGPTVAWVST